MPDLLKEVKYVKGVGPNRVSLLNRLNIYTLKDLITYYPRTHEDRSIPKNISKLNLALFTISSLTRLILPVIKA